MYRLTQIDNKTLSAYYNRILIWIVAGVII